MEPAIEVQGVSKTFRFRPYAKGSLSLKSAVLDALLLRPRPPLVVVRALESVSLAVAPGEMLAVLGRNGAGKTTLLRIVAQVYKPDAGTVRVRGRVGSLVELGAGFHPELSGRENVEVAGLIAGLGRREIRERAPAIFAFAGVEESFLDAPVRTYSSGMLVRLGFAVASEVEPRVLLVDEALAVGDPAFQRKCVERIRSLQKGGTAVVVVSHDLATMEALADRALVLEHGKVADLGPAKDVVPRFRASLGASAVRGGLDGPA